MVSSGKWGDLSTRLMSAVFMVVVGGAAIWMGGTVFTVLIAIVCAAMLWELTRLLASDSGPLALVIGITGGCAVLVSTQVSALIGLGCLALPIVLGGITLQQKKFQFIVYGAAVLAAGIGLLLTRNAYGLGWLAFVVGVVVATDVAGYFAGRLLGGPKFWPSISPKKTWSGTAAGWLVAALIGLLAASGLMTSPLALAIIAIALSFASQMGDIAESALKRQAGIKDSSNLIPGHGGVLDRFDGMLGAALVFLIIQALVTFPVSTP